MPTRLYCRIRFGRSHTDFLFIHFPPSISHRFLIYIFSALYFPKNVNGKRIASPPPSSRTCTLHMCILLPPLFFPGPSPGLHSGTAGHWPHHARRTLSAFSPRPAGTSLRPPFLERRCGLPPARSFLCSAVGHTGLHHFFDGPVRPNL